MQQVSLAQTTTLTTSASETTIVTADTSVRNHLVALVLSCTTAGAAGTLTLRNTTGGAAVMVIDFPNSTTASAAIPVVIDFAPPLEGLAVNNNWTIQSSSASNSFHVTAIYIKEQ